MGFPQFKLGRLQEFDPRSLAYKVIDLLTTDQQSTVVSKSWDCPIELNQGETESCVGHGHAHNLASQPVENTGVTESIAQTIYSTAQTLDPWAGTPHEGSTVLAGAKAVQKLWPKAYGSYHWALSIADVLAALSHVGPCVFGVTWFSSMYTPNAKGQIEVNPNSGVAGGHCIEGVEVNVQTHMIRLHNSWGRGWGINGDCWITWHDLNYLLMNGGECCVATNRSLVTI